MLEATGPEPDDGPASASPTISEIGRFSGGLTAAALLLLATAPAPAADDDDHLNGNCRDVPGSFAGTAGAKELARLKEEMILLPPGRGRELGSQGT